MIKHATATFKKNTHRSQIGVLRGVLLPKRTIGKHFDLLRFKAKCIISANFCKCNILKGEKVQLRLAASQTRSYFCTQTTTKLHQILWTNKWIHPPELQKNCLMQQWETKMNLTVFFLGKKRPLESSMDSKKSQNSPEYFNYLSRIRFSSDFIRGSITGRAAGSSAGYLSATHPPVCPW